VINIKNSTDSDENVTVVVNNEMFNAVIPAHSINTFLLKGSYDDTEDSTEAV
jgi:O-glycosyl hydrolase